jgi:hypothetical protein
MRAQELGRPPLDGVIANVDSDLAEPISALKQSFERRSVPASFGKGDAALISELRGLLKLPRRYREFLLEVDPLDVETRTPAERVRLIPSTRLKQEQIGFALTEAGELIGEPTSSGWRPSWIIVAHSALLGDPYFLDTARLDAEGDCAVYTAMSGTEIWKPRLCASSFALFVRILAIGMEVAEGFADDNIDMDDEQVFRDTFGPKIREYDPAALKAGHWT